MSFGNFVIGGLFPKKGNGQYNMILSDGLSRDGNRVFANNVDLDNGDLNASLDISTKQIRIPGMDAFINNCFIFKLIKPFWRHDIFLRFIKG